MVLFVYPNIISELVNPKVARNVKPKLKVNSIGIKSYFSIYNSDPKTASGYYKLFQNGLLINDLFTYFANNNYAYQKEINEKLGISILVNKTRKQFSI